MVVLHNTNLNELNFNMSIEYRIKNEKKKNGTSLVGIGIVRTSETWPGLLGTKRKVAS